MDCRTLSTLGETIPLDPTVLLRYRLRRLTKETSHRIAARTRMFDSQRTEEDLSNAIEYFPVFLATHLAIAWSIYIANAVPYEDSKIYSNRYLDLDIGSQSFLNTLVGCVLEGNLLSDYRLGFLVGLITACHTMNQENAQKQLWHECKSQLSNLFASMSVRTELGVEIFLHYANSPKGCDLNKNRIGTDVGRRR